MAKYRFEAKAVNGREMQGEIEARSEAEARIKLRSQKLTPLKLVQAGTGGIQSAAVVAAAAKKKKGGPAVKHKDLQIFTRQLSTLLSSGVPILQSMDTLCEGARSPGLVYALKEIVADVSKGKRFGDALAEHPKVFDRFYVNMVRAGEESGNLDQILTRLSEYIEKAVKIQGKIKGAMVYPVAILFVAGCVVAGLLVFVIPKFQSLFASSGQELPAMTKIVVVMSNTFINYWYLIIGGTVGFVYGLIKYYESPKGREVCDAILIDVPFIGDLLQKGAVAKFTRTLSTLLGSGVGIMEALDIASRVVGNHVIERAILRSKDAIAEGKSLTVPLSKEKYMPHMVVQMIGVGEQTGNLDTMLTKVADFYEDEVDVAVSALTSVLEPLMMVVLGGIVAFFVVAMYLPIFSLAGSVGG
jgi:type IV pilus assembly protein PilC